MKKRSLSGFNTITWQSEKYSTNYDNYYDFCENYLYFSSKNSNKYTQKKNLRHLINDKLILYLVYDISENKNMKLYISDEENQKLKEKGYIKITQGCDMANKLLNLDKGKTFNINEYEYKLNDKKYFDNKN